MVEKEAQKPKIKKESDKSKDCMVKIDSRIYNHVRQRVQENFVEYPSIKNFLEKAAMHELAINPDFQKPEKAKEVFGNSEKRHKTWIG